jgi:hypothetical protein
MPVAGMNWLSWLALRGCPFRLSILGMQGPWMSASRTPTLLPKRARLMARLAVTVLLPTPPLPLIIAILFLIWVRFWVRRCFCWHCCFVWSGQFWVVVQVLYLPLHSVVLVGAIFSPVLCTSV